MGAREIETRDDEDQDLSYAVNRTRERYGDVWVIRYEHRIAPKGTHVTITSVSNQGFNGMVAAVILPGGERRAISMGALVPAERW
jgi:hypothetical protein